MSVPLRRPTWLATLAIALVAASAALYYVHYLIFRDAHHVIIYLLGDVAFLPVEVLIVTLILHRLLTSHELRGRLEKLNMVIGAFMSEVGDDLLSRLAAADPEISAISSQLAISARWSNADYRRTARALKRRACRVEMGRVDLAALRELLGARRDFLLRLLENPNVLEHESFTELLRAVFHLAEELEHRAALETLPGTDLAHLSVDLARVYGLLAREWLAYMNHLREQYPYLFSLAVRTNPFDREASAVVT